MSPDKNVIFVLERRLKVLQLVKIKRISFHTAIYVQIIDDEAQTTLVSARSQELGLKANMEGQKRLVKDC